MRRAVDMPGVTRLLKLLNILIVNVVVFLIVFLALEYSARAYTYLRNGRSFFRPNTFISPWITTYDFPPPMVDAGGKYFFRHRTNPTPLNKPENTLRIIAVGGSTTVCKDAYRITGVDYPIALERRLQIEFPDLDVEVLNAGGDAYSTAQILINLEFRLVEFDPDIIVLMENINDSTVNFFLDGATSDYSNKYLQTYFLNPNLQGTLSITGFLTQSRLLSRFGLPQLLADQRGDIRLENDFDRGRRYFVRNLESIWTICELNDIELVLLSQPSSMEPHPFVSTEAFLAYNKEIERVALDRGIHFVDMFELMERDERFFVDQVHYSPEGVERFAELLSTELAAIPVAVVERWSRDGRDDSVAVR